MDLHMGALALCVTWMIFFVEQQRSQRMRAGVSHAAIPDSEIVLRY
jgi:hypothetical protein